ncbi:MAG: type II toxin-antitoxin system death-on-curing family toxin [Bacteroidota bacterium]
MTRTDSEPRWLEEPLVRFLHQESIRLFGGLPGIRDAGMLASALNRPRDKWGYGGESDLETLAAAYAFGLAKNHPFLDGNKRTALLSIRAFLFRNGLTFEPGEAETVVMIEGLAGGTVSESELAEWIRASAQPSDP